MKPKAMTIPKGMFNTLSEHGLTSTEFIMLVAIHNLYTKEHGCFASNEKLGRIVCPKKPLTKRSTSRIITNLESHGLIVNIGMSGVRMLRRSRWNPPIANEHCYI